MLEEIERVKSLIRATVDGERRGEWIEVGTRAFCWDGANIFRVRDANCERWAFGSSIVVGSMVRGLDVAHEQAYKLGVAEIIRSQSCGIKRAPRRTEN